LTDAKSFLIYCVLSRNTSETEETLKWMKELDGVANVRMGEWDNGRVLAR
jgi:hypothetical protein